MSITLWVLRLLLAVAFFAHGWLLLMPPPENSRTDERLAAAMVLGVLGWVDILAAVD